MKGGQVKSEKCVRKKRNKRNKRKLRSFTGAEGDTQFPLFPNDTNFPDFFRAYPCEDRLVRKIII